MTVPRHEGNQNVGAERQLTEIGGSAVSDRLPGLHPFTNPHEGALVDSGILIRPPELLEAIPVVLHQTGQRHLATTLAVEPGINNDLVSGHLADLARPLSCDHSTGVHSYFLFEAGAHKRGLWEQQRHRLPLHVTSHKRPVGVVMLEERDQRGSDRHQLLGRHVHEIDAAGRQHGIVVPLAAQGHLVYEPA